jgi:hypothetical protein
MSKMKYLSNLRLVLLLVTVLLSAQTIVMAHDHDVATHQHDSACEVCTHHKPTSYAPPSVSYAPVFFSISSATVIPVHRGAFKHQPAYSFQPRAPPRFFLT